MSSANSTRASHLNFTRRGLLALAAGGILSNSIPKHAYASAQQDPAQYDNWEPGKSAQELWDAAVSEANAAGEPVIENQTCCQVGAIPYSSISTRATANILVMGQPDVVSAVAVYETGTDAFGNKIITTLQDTWLTLTTGTVTNSTYSYTRLDGGRTLSIKYTASFKNYLGFTQTYVLYAEFYYNGNANLRVS